MENKTNQISFRVFGFAASVITFLIFLPALKNGFVNWDDPLYIYNNPNIRSIDVSFFKWSMTNADVGHWHPLTWVSLALDYAIWGLDPVGFHLSNIFLHSINTLLVFVLTIQLVRLNGIEKIPMLIAGVVTALIFGIHPLRVESVAWTSERKDVLSAFFFLSSLLLYLKYRFQSSPERQGLYYGLCLVSFSCALLSR